MTVSSTTNRVSYTGNGVTTAFAFSNPFQAQADLKVLLVLISTGAETLQTITTHYTISGTTTNGVYASGGTVNMVSAPSALYKLVIYRDPALTQTIDLVENDALPAETLEQGLDKSVMVAQRVRELVDRAMSLPDGFTGTFDTSLPSDIETADAVLKVNAAGDAFEMGPTTSEIEDAEANAIAAAASASAASASAAAAATSAAAAAVGTFTDAILQDEIATPSTPASGKMKIYPKSNNVLHTLNDGGIERQLVSTLQNDLLENITISASVSANALTIAYKDAAGNNCSSTSPSFVTFGDKPITSGLPIIRSITAALAITIPSGATLGCRNATYSEVYVYLLDDAGTIDIGVCRIKLPEDILWSSAAISTSADDSYNLYSVTGRTAVRIKCIGLVGFTQATAGVYATAPSKVSSNILPQTNIGCFVNSDAGTTYTNNTNSSVVLEDIVQDPLSLWDSSNEFTAPLDGFYQASSVISFAATTQFNGTSESIEFSIQSNAVSRCLNEFCPTSSSNVKSMVIAGAVYANRLEKIRFRVTQVSGADLNVSTSANRNFGSISYIGRSL